MWSWDCHYKQKIIAQKLNDEFRDGKPVRNDRSLATAIRKYKKGKSFFMVESDKRIPLRKICVSIFICLGSCTIILPRTLKSYAIIFRTVFANTFFFRNRRMRIGAV